MKQMTPPNSSPSPPPRSLSFYCFFFFVSIPLLSAFCTRAAVDHATDGGGGGGVWRRALLGFKETPGGNNRTFDCSPSGACVPCNYSEKRDEMYRCSETGYRIPLKCVEIMDGGDGKKSQNSRSAMELSQVNANPHEMLREFTTNKQRILVDDSSRSQEGFQSYTTYRSCIPAVNEEKLSVLGFEGIILCLLLMSGFVVYFRKKRTVTMPGVGAGRIQMNSRF